MMNWESLDISIQGLQQHYQNGDFTPKELVGHLITKAKAYDHKNIWIKALSIEEIQPYVDSLDNKNIADTPLYGVPFAIKDNIDLAHQPTTAACTAYTYLPERHAFVVNLLIEAGAIPMGKTNMDQFATGLVGTRSPEPWGPCKNAFNDQYISGGSSSGSAVAVSHGLVSFSLGTDTAGSGRVPAAFNQLIGVKPTKGLLSTQGVVPACRSLDVVSIFALAAADATAILNVAAKFDKHDPYARNNPIHNSSYVSGSSKIPLSLGIPKKSQLNFFNDAEAEHDFFKSVERWQSLGASIVEIDFQVFIDAAKLLYEGPWVAERFLAIEETLKHAPETMHPAVRTIVESGNKSSATDTFKCFYQLQAFKRLADETFDGVDLLITPTTGTSFTIGELFDNPIALNSQLGYYTNYMNLLDYAAIALPNSAITTPVPNGFTLVGRAFDDQRLLAEAARWLEGFDRSLGCKLSINKKPDTSGAFKEWKTVKVAVCGAHLEGQGLNWQLTERGATLLSKTTSAPHYRLYALPDGKRPAMVRNDENGAAITVEVWQLPAENFGSFVAAIPAPLGIGKTQLADGTWCSGFICEGNAVAAAKDITEFGGWRAYLASRI